MLPETEKCVPGSISKKGSKRHNKNPKMPKSYAEWAKFNVEEELTKTEELEQLEEKKKQRENAAKSKSKLEKDLSQSTEVQAEVLSAKARVAALKAKKKENRTTTSNEAHGHLLHVKASLLQSKSNTLKKIMQFRDDGKKLIPKHENELQEILLPPESIDHLGKKQCLDAILKFEDGLDELKKYEQFEKELADLENNLELSPTGRKSSSGDIVENNSKHIHHADGCSHDSTEPPKISEAILPSQTDGEGIAQMFRHDMYIGLGRCYYYLQNYAMASETFKKVLLVDRNNVEAWVGRGAAFLKMRVPLIAFLHSQQIETLEKDNENAADIKEKALSMQHEDTSKRPLLVMEKDLLTGDIIRTDKINDVLSLLEKIEILRDETDLIMQEGLYNTCEIRYQAIISTLHDVLKTPLLQNCSDDSLSQIIYMTMFGCHMNLAGCCLEAATKYDKAIRSCSVALHIPKQNWLNSGMISLARYRRGQAYHHSRKFAEALNDYEEAKRHCDDPKKLAELEKAIDKCIFDRGQLDYEFIKEGFRSLNP